MRKIGEIIKLHRELANLSTQELATKVRIGSATLEKYEASLKIPDRQTILKISTVLDIPASEFFQEEQVDEELLQLIKQIGVVEAKEILKKTINKLST